MKIEILKNTLSSDSVFLSEGTICSERKEVAEKMIAGGFAKEHIVKKEKKTTRKKKSVPFE